MTIRSLLLLAAPAALLAGCGSDSGTTGAMQQSTTRPDCAPEDTACQEDGLDAPLAMGAKLPLDVHVTARGVSAPKIALEPTRDDILAVEGATLVGKAPGWSSVMFVGTDGLVMDFVTLTVEAPERIDVYRLTKEGGVEPSPLPAKIQLAPGDDFEIAVKAFSGPVRLLGELDASFAIDAPVATILDSGRPASRRLRVKSPGTATLTVAASGFTRTLSLEVLP
jgi:hypothetical protein